MKIKRQILSKLLSGLLGLILGIGAMAIWHQQTTKGYHRNLGYAIALCSYQDMLLEAQRDPQALYRAMRDEFADPDRAQSILDQESEKEGSELIFQSVIAAALEKKLAEEVDLLPPDHPSRPLFERCLDYAYWMQSQAEPLLNPTAP